MNEKLFKLLEDKFGQALITMKIGKDKAKKELLPVTRKELETVLEENSHLLDEPTEIQTALKEFFHKIKADIESYIDYLEENEWIIDEDGSNTEKISVAWQQHNFATEVEQFQVNIISV